MKIYLLIVGAKIKGYTSLSVLCKEAGLDKKYIKENLPVSIGRLTIQELDVDERVF